MAMLLADAHAFGALLRTLRLACTVQDPRSPRRLAPLSQNGLARAAGYDAAHINRLERGLSGAPSCTTVLAIARALELDEVTTDELLAAAGHCPEIIARLDGDQRRSLLAALWEPHS